MQLLLHPLTSCLRLCLRSPSLSALHGLTYPKPFRFRYKRALNRTRQAHNNARRTAWARLHATSGSAATTSAPYPAQQPHTHTLKTPSKKSGRESRFLAPAPHPPASDNLTLTSARTRMRVQTQATARTTKQVPAWRPQALCATPCVRTGPVTRTRPCRQLGGTQGVGGKNVVMGSTPFWRTPTGRTRVHGLRSHLPPPKSPHQFCTEPGGSASSRRSLCPPPIDSLLTCFELLLHGLRVRLGHAHLDDHRRLLHLR